MLVSMAAALLTMALKFMAWDMTGPVGLFSDALESLVNLAAVVLGFVLPGLLRNRRHCLASRAELCDAD